MKNAYTLIQTNKEVNHLSDNSDFWRKLWNLKVPAKVKNLLWRAVTGCLPCKVQLRTKNVAVNDTCPMCNEGAESIIHGLVTCSFSTTCWNIIDINTRWNNQISFGDWLQSMFDSCGRNELQLVTILLWSIWRCRNEVVWNQKGMEVQEVVESTKLILNQW